MKNVQDEADTSSSEGERTLSNASSPSSSIGSKSEENAKSSEQLRFDRPQNLGSLCDVTPITTSVNYMNTEMKTLTRTLFGRPGLRVMIRCYQHQIMPLRFPSLSNIKKILNRLHFGDSDNDKTLPDDDCLDLI